MFFLAENNQSVDYLLIIIIGITIAIIGLVVYYVITNSKKKNETPRSNVNFETKPIEPVTEVQENITVTNEQVQVEQPVSEVQTQEQIELEDQKTSTNIASLLEEMQKDLDKTEEQVERYEADQEENAIISYKELMRVKAEREKSLVLEDKPVEEIKEVIKNTSEPKTEEVKKFKRSEFISPIFGLNETTNVTYREIKRPPRKEETPKKKYDEWESDKLLKKLEDDSAEVIELEEHEVETVIENQESKRNDNFLEALVDFRSKLD